MPSREVNIPDSQVLEYYEKNKTTDPQLSEPLRFSFTHIRVKTLEDANAVIKRLEKKEEPAALAKKLSTAPDAQTSSGVIRKADENLIKNVYGEAFLDALKAVSEGKIIGPIPYAGEYEIAKHEGSIASTIIPFDQIKNTLKTNLEQKAGGKAAQDLVSNLKKAAEPKIYRSSYVQEPNKPANF